MSPRQLLRLFESRTLEEYDDQKTPAQIQQAEVDSTTANQLLHYVISQIQWIIGTGDWKDPVPIDLDSVLDFTYAFRTGCQLLSTADPRVFLTEEPFRHSLTGLSIEVFHNGRRLEQSPTDNPLDGEYWVFEEIGGAGYNAIKFLRWTPTVRSHLRANYVVE